MSEPERTASRRWRPERLRRRLRQVITRRLYRDLNDHVDGSLLIAGTARSGTTWLAEIVAAELSGRLVFEPFHSEQVRDFQRFHAFHYMRPEDEDEHLLEFARRVLSGRIRHPWIDRYVETLRPRVRVVKEIRANLFLRWLKLRFPEVPLVLVVRHPCAVVASRIGLGWATDRDLAPLLAQRALVDDFLADHMSVIEGARRPEEKHAVFWCVAHLVPLRQFPPGELELVFYEDLCTELEREIPRVFRALGHPLAGDLGTRAARSSMTSRATRGAKRRIDGWREELAPAQIENVLRVVQSFGLDGLYGDQISPRHGARERDVAVS